mgnify:CR=1 FL=1
MEVEIDIEKLRRDLIDYFGTAIFVSSPLSIMELSKIEKATEEELIKIAQNNNIDLNKYTYDNKKIR